MNTLFRLVVLAVLLPMASNLFMNFARYGHLQRLDSKSRWISAPVN